jgi:uncharacterized membrane protein YfhO
MAMLSSSRSGHSVIPLFATANTYWTYIVGFTSAAIPKNVAYEGFAVCTIVLLPVLFMRRKRDFTVRVMLAIFFVMLVFPFFGTVLNGMLFPSYRILFAEGLFLAMAVASILSDPEPLSRKELIVSIVVFAIYSVLVYFGAKPVQYRNVLRPLLIGLVTWALFAGETWWVTRRRAAGEADASTSSSKGVEWFRVAVVTLVVASIALNSYNMFTPRVLESYLKRGVVMKRFKKDIGAQIARLPGAGLWRAEKQTHTTGDAMGVAISNDPLVQGFNGTTFYFSIMSRGMFDYVRGLDDRAMKFAFDFQGFDDRATMLTLNAVRYYAAANTSREYVPYGFTPYISNELSTIYLNRFALPAGYMYHSVVPRAQFDAMAPLARQQSMLDGIVLDPGVTAGLPATTATSNVIDVPYSITSTGAININRQTGTMIVSKAKDRIHLNFSAPADSEIYVDMTGSKFVDSTGIDPNWTFAGIGFGTVGVPKVEQIDAPDYHYGFGDTSQLANLGYWPAGLKTAYVRPEKVGTFTFTGLHVYALPMTDFAQKIARFQSESMRDVVVGTNSLKGRITARTPGLVFLSVPFSVGWHATVDGKPVKILQANLGFMAVPVSAGDHAIELHYTTPGLLSGAIITFVTLAGLVAWWAVRRRRTAAAEKVAA